MVGEEDGMWRSLCMRMGKKLLCYVDKRVKEERTQQRGRIRLHLGFDQFGGGLFLGPNGSMVHSRVMDYGISVRISEGNACLSRNSLLCVVC